jgi:hypothetical protein
MLLDSCFQINIYETNSNLKLCKDMDLFIWIMSYMCLSLVVYRGYLHTYCYHWVETFAGWPRGYHPSSSQCFDSDMVY